MAKYNWHLPISRLPGQLTKLPQARQTIVYCCFMLQLIRQDRGYTGASVTSSAISAAPRQLRQKVKMLRCLQGNCLSKHSHSMQRFISSLFIARENISRTHFGKSPAQRLTITCHSGSPKHPLFHVANTWRMPLLL